MISKKHLKTQKNTGKPARQLDNTKNTITINRILEANKRIRETINKTPMDTSSTFAEKSNVEKAAFKLENLQKTGAFKIRGAYNKLSQLSKQEKNKGVIAASSGNHAQGVALAADKIGAKAKIVMSKNTSESKIKATENYGAKVVLEGEEYEQAYKHAKNLEKQEELSFIHPYNDKKIIAGQGTLGLEILDQFPEVDTVLVAIGGGGLISGIAAAIKQLKPETRIIGVQTKGCGSAKQTMKSKDIYEREQVDTVAKGIATRKIGKIPAQHIRELVDEVVYVSDQEVEATSALLAERQKVVVEPAGAVAATALLYQQKYNLGLENRKVAVPLCGGNIDLKEFGEICQRGRKYLEQEGDKV